MSAAAAPLTPSQEVHLHNILLATDFSPCSDLALKMAAALARQHQSQLTVLHTVPPTPIMQASMEPSTWGYDQLRERAEELLETVRKSPVVDGLNARFINQSGDLLRAAQKLVETEHVDLIVVGTHGRTGLKKILMGSVAEEIERLLCTPVLAIGPAVQPEILNRGTFRSILYSTDFSVGSEHALNYAIAFARESGAKLHVLHVILEELVTALYLHDEMERNCRERLTRLIPPGLLPSEPELLVTTGLPAEEIVRLAMAKKADLIAMGIHHSGMTGAHASAHVPWSVANAVLAHAPCPVLTVCGKPQ